MYVYQVRLKLVFLQQQGVLRNRCPFFCVCLFTESDTTFCFPVWRHSDGGETGGGGGSKREGRSHLKLAASSILSFIAANKGLIVFQFLVVNSFSSACFSFKASVISSSTMGRGVVPCAASRPTLLRRVSIFRSRRTHSSIDRL